MSSKPNQEGPVAKKKAAADKMHASSLETLGLPREDELALEEEIAASGRSLSTIIVEALRIRKGALDAIGIEIEITMATELSQLVASHCRAGSEVLGRMKEERQKSPARRRPKKRTKST